MFIFHSTALFCGKGIMKAANEYTAFSGKECHTSEAKFGTAVSSYCLHMHSVQTCKMPLINTLLWRLSGTLSVTSNICVCMCVCTRTCVRTYVRSSNIHSPSPVLSRLASPLVHNTVTRQQ